MTFSKRSVDRIRQLVDAFAVLFFEVVAEVDVEQHVLLGFPSNQSALEIDSDKFLKAFLLRN